MQTPLPSDPLAAWIRHKTEKKEQAMAEIMIFTADQADRPATDGLPLAFRIAETEDHIELTADVTGFEEDEIELTLADGELTVSGCHEEEEEEEVAGGDDDESADDALGFTQSFAVPEGLETSQIDASLVDGLLTIVIDKRASSEPSGAH